MDLALVQSKNFDKHIAREIIGYDTLGEKIIKGIAESYITDESNVLRHWLFDRPAYNQLSAGLGGSACKSSEVTFD